MSVQIKNYLEWALSTAFTFILSVGLYRKVVLAAWLGVGLDWGRINGTEYQMSLKHDKLLQPTDYG